jgi:hypothetical protein
MALSMPSVCDDDAVGIADRQNLRATAITKNCFSCPLTFIVVLNGYHWIYPLCG